MLRYSRFLPVFILLSVSLAACREGSDPLPEAATPTSVAVAPEAVAPGAAATEAVVIQPTATPEPTVAPTATPIPPKTLTICMAAEPESLYLYGDTSVSANGIRSALYEPLFTNLGYAYQPLALATLPSLATGDARIEPVEVSAGSLVIDLEGDVVVLARDVQVRDVNGEIVRFNRTPILMPQMTVDFTFQPLVWSDGTPVSADDSRFSYELAADRRTPTLDERIDTTALYEATGDLTVRWSGVPGYLPDNYMTKVWTPLPRHQLGGVEAATLPTMDETVMTPLSYGPFQVDEWVRGESIRLSPNPHYYRAAAGLPHIEQLTFRFIGANTEALPDDYATCDIMTQDALSVAAMPALLAAEEAGDLTVYSSTSQVMEYLLFGITEYINYRGIRPDWFEAPAVRQAIAQCIDRQALVDDLAYGRAPIEHSYIPVEHPLAPDDLPIWEFDAAAGNATLDELGYLDSDGDGVREDVASGKPFSVTLGTNEESALRMGIIERISANLADCGIRATVTPQPASSWFAPGPDGPVFGRNFALAEFPWVSNVTPNCEIFTTTNIPGAVDMRYLGWDVPNVGGWTNEAFDAACLQAGALLPGQDGFEQAHQEAARIFAAEMPALPLFSRLRVAAAAPHVLNFDLDPTQTNELWNLFELDSSKTP